MPTLLLGWNSVPRCRTIMLPARQAWPPLIFRPRYLGCAPPLLRELPPAFLVALQAHKRLYRCVHDQQHKPAL